MEESVSRGLKPGLGWVEVSGLKPGPISKAKTKSKNKKQKQKAKTKSKNNSKNDSSDTA